MWNNLIRIAGWSVAVVCLGIEMSVHASTKPLDPSTAGQVNSTESVDFLIKHTSGDFTKLLDAMSAGDAPDWPVCFSSKVNLPIAAYFQLENDLLRGHYYRFLQQLRRFQATIQKLEPKVFNMRITQLVELRNHIAKRRTYPTQVLVDALNGVLFVELAKQIVLRRDVSDAMRVHIARVRALKTDPADILAYVALEVGRSHTVTDLDEAARRNVGGRAFESTVSAGFLDGERLRRIGYWIQEEKLDQAAESEASQVYMGGLGFVSELAFRDIARHLMMIQVKEANIQIGLPLLAIYVERAKGRLSTDSTEVKRVLNLTPADKESLGSNIAPLITAPGESTLVTSLIRAVQNGLIRSHSLFDLDDPNRHVPKEKGDVE